MTTLETIDFDTFVQQFFADVAAGATEIYNEFSLQHEFGCRLRATLAGALKVQFERPVTYFGLDRTKYLKKEIDISILTADCRHKYAVELKFPRNGQHPEQIFKACQDICFLEQLCRGGFDRCWFLIVVDDPLFYARGAKGEIYQYFRSDIPIHGRFLKPTGARDESILVSGRYPIVWKDISREMKYALVDISETLEPVI